MTETENVATYARIRPYNPAINEDKRLTARASGGNKILNQNGANQDTYNFTKVYDMTDSTNDLFETGMKPLLDYKILQGINSIFIVYGQSGSGKSFTLIGEEGHLGVLPLSLQYLLKQDKVESIHVASIEAYGIKATKIGFYDLVYQLKEKQKAPKKFDAYSTKDNSRVNSGNAEKIEITEANCLSVITELQEVSHMAPTLKNPHSSRGHTVYFNQIKMKGLEDVYFIAVDLAGSEGQTALGTKDEFVEGLKLAMSKGKLKLNKKQMKGFETMYKTRSLEAGCINNGLTQLQTIFSELIKKKISKARGLGLRKVLSSFISLKSAYAILFTLSASANNNKVTRATLNFAKQTQLVKVDTQKAKAKIDKDAIIKELNALIEELRGEMAQKNDKIKQLKHKLADSKAGDETSINIADESGLNLELPASPHSINRMASVAVLEAGTETFEKYEQLARQLSEIEQEEAQWQVADDLINAGDMNEDEMKAIFDEFDEDCGGSIDAEELQHALKRMGHDMTMDEVHDLIHEIDENGDGEVDFDEFKVMAEKSWFVDAFQSKLVASMERMMNAMNIMDEDEDEDEDVDDDKEAEFESDEEYDIFDTDELVGVLKERKQTIMDLEKQLSQMQGLQVLQEEESVDDLTEQIEDQDDTIDELQGDLQKMIQESEDKEEMERLRDEMQDKEQKYKEDIDKLHEQIASLMADQLVQSKEQEEKQKERKRDEDLRQEMKDNLDGAQRKIDELQNENERLKGEKKTFEEENGALKNNIDTLQNDNDEAKHELNAIETENEELKRKIDVYDVNNEDNDSAMKAIKTERDEFENTMNELRKEYDELKSRMKQLEDDNIKLNEDMNEIQNELKSVSISKINMIEECNEQLNLLRSGIRVYQKSQTPKWLPFTVDIKWED